MSAMQTAKGSRRPCFQYLEECDINQQKDLFEVALGLFPIYNSSEHASAANERQRSSLTVELTFHNMHEY